MSTENEQINSSHDKYPSKEEHLESNVKQKYSIEIIEGHDGGSKFWIMPVKIDENSEWGVAEFKEEEISIDELDVECFLYYFLDKYFDPNFPYEKIRLDCSGENFEWYLEYNIYTYDTVKKMLADIRDTARLFTENYDDPRLDGVKKYYRPGLFGEAEIYSHDYVRDNIDVAIDFYERFSQRLEAMMKNSPDHNLISFMGP